MTTSADRRTAGIAKSAALAALLCFPLAACGRGGPAEHYFAGPTMGTEYHVKIVADLDPARRDQAARAIEEALGRVNALMSTYRPDSELSRLNRHEGPEPFPLSPETAAVFAAALEICAETNGAFDITVGPLVNAYGFGPDAYTDPPDTALIAELRGRVGCHLVALDPARATVAKARPDVYCDLSAIAKGHGVDAVAAALDNLGIARYMVEVGGEVRARGANLRGQPWRIGIERPDTAARGLHRAIPLRDTAMATSGDYRNFREIDGRRVSHTIDPRTGRPVAHDLASVTVLHPECARADAYATALMVLGPELGAAFAEEKNLAALFLIHTGDGPIQERATPAFDQLTHPD